MAVRYKSASKSLKRNPQLLTLVNPGKRKSSSKKGKTMARRKSPARDAQGRFLKRAVRKRMRRNYTRPDKPETPPRRGAAPVLAKGARRRPGRRAPGWYAAGGYMRDSATSPSWRYYKNKKRRKAVRKRPVRRRSTALAKRPVRRRAVRRVTRRSAVRRNPVRRRALRRRTVRKPIRRRAVRRSPARRRAMQRNPVRRRRVVRRRRRVYRRNQGILGVLKPVAVGTLGFLGSRALANLAGQHAHRLPAQVAPYAGIGASGLVLLGSWYLPKKVKVLAPHKQALLIGAGIAFAEQLVAAFAPANVQEYIQPPSGLEGADLDAYERALAQQGMLGAFVPTGVAEQEGLGAFVPTGIAEQEGLGLTEYLDVDAAEAEGMGAFVSTSMAEQEGLGAGMFSSAQSGTDEVVGLGPTLSEALGAAGVPPIAAKTVATRVRSAATRAATSAVRAGASAPAAQRAATQRAMVVAQQHQLDLTPTIQQAVQNEVQRILGAAGNAALRVVQHEPTGGLGGIFEKNMFD